VQIKWPNDLLADGAKLAGILLERSGDAIVIGFGANLSHFPEGLERPVTSILTVTGSAPDPSHFAQLLAERLAAWISRWRSEGVAPIRTAWLGAAHPLGAAISTSEATACSTGWTRRAHCACASPAESAA
jgi:BirA family biotin operon repressor/biotin-[acetyl-CoA-carboxylase] ligase